MIDLYWEEKQGAHVVRLVVAGYPSEEEIEGISHELLELPDRSDGKIVVDFLEVIL